MKILDYEKLTLEAFMKLPPRKLLYHQFESSEDFLAGYVSRFLKGERFCREFTAYTKEENEIIDQLIQKNLGKVDGVDLLNAKLLTKATCNILNKYKLTDENSSRI